MSGYGLHGLFDEEIDARTDHLGRAAGEPGEKADPTLIQVGRAFKQGKIAGSKSFAKLVKEMRDAQQGFFKSKPGSVAKKDYLAKAKKLEEQVDRSIEIILK